MSPSKGTPPKAVRVEPGLWAAAKEKAAERGETVSDVLRRALVAYVEDDLPAAPADD